MTDILTNNRTIPAAMHLARAERHLATAMKTPAPTALVSLKAADVEVGTSIEMLIGDYDRGNDPFVPVIASDVRGPMAQARALLEQVKDAREPILQARSSIGVLDWYLKQHAAGSTK